MERRLVQIENIHIGSRHREPDMAKVREIAKSITDIGLLNPPAIVFRDGSAIGEPEEENVPVLIYGRHRLLALQSLGKVAVECIVHNVDDLHAELMEIDENLARSDLSPAQEVAHIARRQVIWRKINGKDGGEETTRNSRSLGGRGNKDFAGEVAAVIGAGRNQESVKRDVQLKIARARGLGEDIHLIVGTSLDKGVEMDALIKLPEHERAELIERAAAGEKVSARPAQQPKPIAADKALDMIANGIIESAAIGSPLIDTIRAAEAADPKAAQRDKFWKMWGSLDDDVREGIFAQLVAMSKAAA